jgi:hypothetical protein
MRPEMIIAVKELKYGVGFIISFVKFTRMDV